jgi:1-acyl-sn-glycerol-3-phosphate acyltransferase
MSVARDALRWGRVASRALVALPAVAATHAIDAERARVQMRRWSSQALEAFGIEVTLEDRNDGDYCDPPYLFVHLNQASLLEIFIYPQVIPVPLRIVMNIEFALLPLLGPTLCVTGSRTIVRQWPAQAKRQMDRVARDMRQRHYSYGMSIEGRRSPDGSLSPFKGGAAHLAIEAQARVVPFFIHGSYDALPSGTWKVRPGRVHAVALPAIDTRGTSQQDRRALTATMRELAEQQLARSDVP